MITSLSIGQIQAVYGALSAIEIFQRNLSLEIDHPHAWQCCEQGKDTLQNLLKRKTEEIYFFDNSQTYIREHILPDGSRVHFAWCIPRLEKLMSNHRTEIIKKSFQIDKLAEWVDFDGLEHARLPFALTNNNPVYVVDYAPSNLEVLIDGNHRVASRLLKYNDPATLVSGFFIPSEIHIKAMISDFQRAFYRVMSNVGRLVVYIEKFQNGNNKPRRPKLFNLGSQK